MQWKRSAAGLLAAWTLAVALPAVPAAAAEDFSAVVLSDGTVAVHCDNPALTEAVVPETLNGYKVTALDEGCFAENTELTQVTLPESLNAIGESAFYGCEKLTGITIPESVEYIGKQAFVKLVSSTDSSGNATTSYKQRYIKIIGVKGSYAETYARYEYYTFEELK